MKKFSLLLIFLLTTGSYAQTVSSSLKATATLNSTCSFSSDNVNFGEWSPVVVKQVYFEIDVKCNRGTPYILRGAPRPTTTYGSSHLLRGSIVGNNDTLRYDIFKNLGGDTWYYYSNLDAARIDGTGTGSHTKHLMRATLAYDVDSQQSRVTPDTYSGSYTLSLTY